MAKIPPKTVSHSDKERLQQLEQELQAVIYGQDHAIAQVVRAMKLARSGLGNPTKPIGSFLDRKSTRLNSSHGHISYAVFCLKKKNHWLRRPDPRTEERVEVVRAEGLLGRR